MIISPPTQICMPPLPASLDTHPFFFFSPTTCFVVFVIGSPFYKWAKKSSKSSRLIFCPPPLFPQLSLLKHRRAVCERRHVVKCELSDGAPPTLWSYELKRPHIGTETLFFCCMQEPHEESLSDYFRAEVRWLAGWLANQWCSSISHYLYCRRANITE